MADVTLFCWTCRLAELTDNVKRDVVDPHTEAAMERHAGHTVTAVDTTGMEDHDIQVLASRHFDLELRIRHADLRELANG